MGSCCCWHSSRLSHIKTWPGETETWWCLWPAFSCPSSLHASSIHMFFFSANFFKPFRRVLVSSIHCHLAVTGAFDCTALWCGSTWTFFGRQAVLFAAFLSLLNGDLLFWTLAVLTPTIACFTISFFHMCLLGAFFWVFSCHFLRAFRDNNMFIFCGIWL